METRQGNPEDEGNDIGTAYVREAGCGVRYIINLEDTDEEQFEVELDREQAERLYVVLGKMLGKAQAVPLPHPIPINPNVSNTFKVPWTDPGTSWPNGWVKPLWMWGR